MGVRREYTTQLSSAAGGPWQGWRAEEVGQARAGLSADSPVGQSS